MLKGEVFYVTYYIHTPQRKSGNLESTSVDIWFVRQQRIFSIRQVMFSFDCISLYLSCTYVYHFMLSIHKIRTFISRIRIPFNFTDFIWLQHFYNTYFISIIINYNFRHNKYHGTYTGFMVQFSNLINLFVYSFKIVITPTFTFYYCYENNICSILSFQLVYAAWKHWWHYCTIIKGIINKNIQHLRVPIKTTSIIFGFVSAL